MVATRNVTSSQSRTGRRKSTAETHEAEVREAQDVGRLHEFPTFATWSDSELRRLVRGAHHESRSTPWPLIHEQTPSDACYILLKGEVGVYVGRDRIATLGPGEVIGESAVRGGRLRSATVTTTGPAEVLRIERDDLARLLDELPALRAAIDETVARHLPVVPVRPATNAESKRSKLNISVPTQLVRRFEQAARIAEVTVAAALEDALTQWVEHRSSRPDA